MNTARICLLAPLFALAACQEVEQPTTVLTQEQWNEVKQNILETAPDPEFKVGANFDNKIELIGFDVETPIKAGQKTTFTWYWKALADIDKNWKVFVHFDSSVKPYRQNLDHVPVRDMYQTSRWKKGQIVKDVQELTINAAFPVGKATPYIGWYRGDTRLPIANDAPKTDEAQPRVIGPSLMVASASGSTKAPPAPAKPTYRLTSLGDDSVKDFTVDGKMEEKFWSQVPPVRLSPFGNAEKVTTWVKAFVTPTHLVVGAQMADQHAWGTLKYRDDETWREEVLEMFLDIDGDAKDYLELQITPMNTVFDARFPVRLGTGQGSRTDQIAKAKAWNLEGLETAVFVDGTVNDDSDEDRGWSVEMKLPLTSIPGLESKPVAAGDQWSLNFYRFDRPKDGTTWAYAWSTAPHGDFHQVDKFGIAEIAPPSKRPVVTPEMLKQMRKNVDLKVRPELKNIKPPTRRPQVGDPPKPR